MKQLRVYFKDFFSKHAEVKQYTFGALTDWQALPDKAYRAVNIEFQNATLPTNVLALNYNITVADRMDANYPDTEHDAVADCTQIILDFMAHLFDRDYTYTASNIQPFRQSTGDITAGAVMAFSIIVPRKSNSCETPLNT